MNLKSFIQYILIIIYNCTITYCVSNNTKQLNDIERKIIRYSNYIENDYDPCDPVDIQVLSYRNQLFKRREEININMQQPRLPLKTDIICLKNKYGCLIKYTNNNIDSLINGVITFNLMSQNNLKTFNSPNETFIHIHLDTQSNVNFNLVRNFSVIGNKTYLILEIEPSIKINLDRTKILNIRNLDPENKSKIYNRSTLINYIKYFDNYAYMNTFKKSFLKGQKLFDQTPVVNDKKFQIETVEHISVLDPLSIG